MGFLEAGTPLEWSDSLEFVKYVREHGIAQFIATYNRIKDRTDDTLKWGDEVRPRRGRAGEARALQSRGGRRA